MKVKLQRINIDVENFNALDHANGERPAQLLGGRTGLPVSPYRRSEESMPDQDYVKLMEERYGICEEGIF
jgi:hypothetical protein